MDHLAHLRLFDCYAAVSIAYDSYRGCKRFKEFPISEIKHFLSYLLGAKPEGAGVTSVIYYFCVYNGNLVN